MAEMVYEIVIGVQLEAAAIGRMITAMIIMMLDCVRLWSAGKYCISVPAAVARDI